MPGSDNIFLARPHARGFRPIPSGCDGPNLSSAPNSIPDIHKLNIHEYEKNVESTKIVHQQTREDSRLSSSQSHNVVRLTGPTRHNLHGSQGNHYENLNQRNSRNSENFRSSSSNFIPNTKSHTAWGRSLPPSSEYEQHLIGIILLTLDTLKAEMVMPTEGYITDCIQCDPRYQTFDVRKALDCAIEHNMVVKQCLGALHFYAGRNGKLWNCVNLTSGHPSDVPNEKWDRIQQFLASPIGRSSILASHCRYEASLILRRSCLEGVVLGEALKILGMIIIVKKWIVPSPSGWQPVTIALESSYDADSSSASSCVQPDQL